LDNSFPAIGGSHAGIGGENSFWPSFTDIMIVVTMIFLMATSLLVVRNWQLVAELQESIAAERMAAQVIESTTQENATLEERLANAEQSNSILRLRLMKKDEELARAEAAIREQEVNVANLELETADLRASLKQAQTQLETETGKLQASNDRNRQLADQLAAVNRQLAEQQRESEQVRGRLETATRQISELQTASASQQQSISELTSEKRSLNQQIEEYNQQLLTLKGDYETVKSKYEELIKPARTARGKYIAEVYYVKGESGNVIRYREPGDDGYTRLSLGEVESRLSALKQEKGKDLYVKIIIPEDSGLSYNEAWNFMRNLLVKYDYYYQK